MEQIIKDGKVLATVFSSKLETDSIQFLTPNEYPLQVGLIQHKEGKQIPFHFHNHFNYNVNTTHEILYVERGQVDVIVTDETWSVVKEVTLLQGDMILLMDGGHSVYCHKGSRIWEIKQGPYPGDKVAKVWKKDHEESFTR